MTHDSRVIRKTSYPPTGGHPSHVVCPAPARSQKMVLIATVLDAEGKIARKVAVAETDGKCWDGDWDSASGNKAEEEARKHETWNQSTAWPLTLLEDEEVLPDWLRRGMGVHVDATGMLRLLVHVADACVLRGRNYNLKISDRDAQRDESGRIVGGTLRRAGARQVVVQMPEANVHAGLLLYRIGRHGLRLPCRTHGAVRRFWTLTGWPLWSRILGAPSASNR